MGTKKKGSELVFNLQWSFKPDCNVIGMCDTPPTTSNFEMFKSYLLKNSGVAGNDVKVTYVTDNGQEWVIDSQEWFEIALSAFRLKARLGEVIYLRLDKIPNRKRDLMRFSDVETQFNVDSMMDSFTTPPDWFTTYMKQFKKEIVQEVTQSVLNAKDNVPIVTSSSKKSKELKRARKHLHFGENPIDKELIKTLKFDRKLENKLDKLDAKTKRIKEKKQALISRIEDAEQRYFGKMEQTEVNNLNVTEEKNENIDEESLPIPIDVNGTPLLNSSLANLADSEACEHMMGGEIYLHTWEIINSGKLQWSPNTELRLTWGSADLVPSVNSVRCPPLKPGEKGSISVRFDIPRKPGTYESYWNFYDKNVRFGRALRCCVIVDLPIASIPILYEKNDEKSPINLALDYGYSELKTFESCKNLTSVEKQQFANIFGFEIDDKENAEKPLELNKSITYKLIQNAIDNNLSSTKEKEKIDELNTKMIKMKVSRGIDSDSDWESDCSWTSNRLGISDKDLIIDLSTSNKVNKEENDKETEVKEEKNETREADNNNNNNNNSGESFSEIASQASSDLSSGYDILQAPVCEEKEESSGYVYITIDGNKLPVPKHILRPDFLANAEEAPGPLTSLNTNKEEKKCEEENRNRLFIFPQNQPGYEVVTNSPVKDDYNWSKSETKYCYPDLQNVKIDPYGPLERSESSASQQANFHCSQCQHQHIPCDASSNSSQQQQQRTPNGVSVHILPENLVSGAVNVASSAINTARSVINMIVPPKTEPGRWVNGHWITENSESLRAKNLLILAEMGFWDSDLNATLLSRYNDDLNKVISELIQ